MVQIIYLLSSLDLSWFDLNNGEISFLEIKPIDLDEILKFPFRHLYLLYGENYSVHNYYFNNVKVLNNHY